MAPQTVVDKPERLAAILARRFEDEARAAVAARGRVSVALPGGSVAAAFFPALAGARVDVSRVDFFWGDERAVPPDDPESNFRAARRLWLEPAGVPAHGIHSMDAGAADLEGAARAYEAVLKRVLGRPAAIDVALLGVGPDGHVCSLFPGHPLLEEQRRWVAAVEDAPKPPPRRLTLTLPALAAARLVVVAAMGEAKAACVRAALEEPHSPLPVARVARSASRALFLLDHAAASALGQRR